MNPLLSIIIPAYNEKKRLQPTFEQLELFLSQKPFPVEVIFIDDGSTDDTQTIITQHIAKKPNYTLLKQPRNMGKGAAIQRCMLAAKGDLRLFTDADLSTPLKETDKFILMIQNSQNSKTIDVVIGSRRLKGARIEKRQPFYREGAGRLFSLLVRWFLLKGFLDTQCGFKMFTAEASQKLFSLLTLDRFGFDIEILFLAKHLFNYEIQETPVKWIDSPATKVRLFKDSLQMFLDIFRIRWKWMKGVYQAAAAHTLGHQ